MPHAPWEVTVGGADATQGLIEPAERVAGASQACSAGGIADLGAGRAEDVFQRLAIQLFLLQAGPYFGGSRNNKGIDANRLALKDFGCRAEIRQLAARARANVGTVELSAADFRHEGPVVRAMGFGDDRLEFRDVVDLLKAVACSGVAFHHHVRLVTVIAGIDVI